jgi:hypothetical protein
MHDLIAKPLTLWRIMRQGELHEGSHQEGGLGSACADAGGDGHAGHRQFYLLLAVTMAQPEKEGGQQPQIFPPS